MSSSDPVDENAIEKFEAAWRRGEMPDVDHFLSESSDRSYLPTLQKLCVIDLEYRWKLSSSDPDHETLALPPGVTSYVQRYPELGQPHIRSALVAEEFVIRRKYGDLPSAESYASEYPELLEELKLLEQQYPTHVGPRDSRQRSDGSSLEIKNYEILDLLGEGGFGQVYRAKQMEPVQRMVAIKVLKQGMASRDVISRFDAERQALAMMDHPNIAGVLDAGVASSGVPYFVMPLVDGTPIVEFCDRTNLDFSKRLALFVDVCRAVHHAHQKGIIHRDIKPSNVLVTDSPDGPIAKVIDFGIAKAVDQPLSGSTVFTGAGQILGTPQYMSPEQAQLNAADVDTRCDIYSLGVLLYELLSGETPFTSAEFQAVAFDEMLRMIRETDPPRPSVRLSQASRPSSSTERWRAASTVRGELDWIVMKAIEKSRDRRYDSSMALAEDVQRYLSGAPVEAGPPSAVYRIRKFARRHRFALMSVAAMVMLLCVGTVVSTWQAIRATRAEQRMSILKDAAEAQASAAEDATDFLTREVLGQVDPYQRDGFAERVGVLMNRDPSAALTDPLPESSYADSENPTLREVFDRAAKRVGECGLPPLVEAEIRYRIGRIYSHIDLGRAAEDIAAAKAQLRRSFEIRRDELGLSNVDTVATAEELIRLYERNGAPEQARELCRDVLSGYQKRFGDQHLYTIEWLVRTAVANSQLGNYDEAGSLMTRAIKIREQHGDSIETHSLLNSVWDESAGYVDPWRKRLVEADILSLEDLKDTLPLLTSPPPNASASEPREPDQKNVSLATLLKMMDSYETAGRYQDVVGVGKQQLERQDLTDESRHVILLRIATASQLNNDFATASQFWSELADSSDSPSLYTAMAGYSLYKSNDPEGAETVLRRLLNAGSTTVPPMAYHLAEATLGAILKDRGQYEEAESFLKSGAAGLSSGGPGSPLGDDARSWTIGLYEAWGKPEEANKWRGQTETP